MLRLVAQVLRENVRATDTAARYAGDEFLLVLPETNLEGAEELAKRIRERFSETLAPFPDANCSLSLGAAEVYEDMVDVEDWIQQADTALYRAKEGGRDRLVAAPRVEVGPSRGPQDAALASAAAPRGAVPGVDAVRSLLQVAGGTPTSRLNARLNAASES
jgi:hypothetical protein